MIIAIIIGVIGSTAYILGYRLDMEKQDVTQINLLQLGTYPANAKIAIDDYELNWTTPGRYDRLEAGWHKVKYWKDGYRDWSKSLNLKPAEVRWIDYARLIPNEIETKDVASFVGAYQVKASPNGNYILLCETPESSVFKLIDISDVRNIKVTDLVLPVDIISGSMSIIEWDSSSNYVLIGSGAEVIRIDRRTPEESLNLSRLFNTSISDPHFVGNNSNIIYALTNTDLRQFDINAKTVSAPMMNNVISYELFGNGKVAYVKQDESGQDVGVWYRDKEYVYEHYDEISPTLIGFTHHWKDDYLLMTRDNKLSIIDKPFEKEHNVVSLDVGEVSFLEHNGSGRLILLGNAGHLTMYDLQTEEIYNFVTSGSDTKPFWLDDYHLGYVKEGVLQTVEFDGANQEALVPSTMFGIYSNNNEHLYTFLVTEAGATLQDSSMIIASSNILGF
ncbi:PEGA domain-containing protein [Ruminococcaceae bacterium OttesenSCG-928-A11]|nr:PEGA domain-containing protein [Ruminococcaceae bacterium OttesenSCG-928-A11]